MAGRKRKLGPRYPNGELRPSGPEPIVPAIWQRIRTEAAKLAGDKRLSSQVGRLSFHRELSDVQASMAFRIGEIYASYEAAKQLSRHARAADYRGISRGQGHSDELVTREGMEKLDPLDPLRKRMEAALAAQAAYDNLREELKAFTLPQVHLIERLCVDDRAIDLSEGWLMRELLDYLIKRFKTTKSQKKAKAAAKRARLLQGAKSKSVSEKLATTEKLPSAEETAFTLFLRKLRPDMKETRKAFHLYQALRDRENERRSQKKRPPH